MNQYLSQLMLKDFWKIVTQLHRELSLKFHRIISQVNKRVEKLDNLYLELNLTIRHIMVLQVNSKSYLLLKELCKSLDMGITTKET